MSNSLAPIYFLFAALATISACGQASAAVVFYSEDFPVAPSDQFIDLDFNNDSIDDLRIDVSWQTREENDGAFVAAPLGSARIASLGGISQSFSVGEGVSLDQLSLLGSPNTVLTGGIVLDALGNPIWEGWGGCTSDLLGNVTCPNGGPNHQIDLFLMEIDGGVAWVDLNPGLLGFGTLGVDWGYLSNAGNSFTITAVPEPRSSTLLVLGGFCLILQRRRKSRRSASASPWPVVLKLRRQDSKRSAFRGELVSVTPHI